MKALTTRWVASCIAAVSIALIISAMVLSYLNRHRVPADLSGWDFSGVLGQVTYLAVPVAGFVLASRRPGNRIGWLFLVAGLALGLNSFSNQYALHALVADRGPAVAGRAFAWLSNWTWVIPVAMLAFLFLLFPTGRVRSRRWRPALWFVSGVFALATIAQLVVATRVWAHPFISPAQA